MDREKVDSEQLIERYLVNDLSAKEREEFEVFCLENPDVAQELEYAQALKEQLTKDHAQEMAAVSLAWYQKPMFASASLVTAIAGISLSTMLYLGRDKTPGLEPPVTADIRIIQTRTGGDASSADVQISEKGTVILHLELDQDMDLPHTILVARNQKALPELSQTLTPILVEGYPELVLLLRNPKPGDYLVMATPEGSQIEKTFRFKLTE